MRRLLAALALAVMLVSPATAAAPSLSPIASIQHYVQVDAQGTKDWRTVCTAFSIDEKRGLFMTAAHCLPEPGASLTLDSQIAWVVYQNDALDIAVLESRGAVRPQLVPCAQNAGVGDVVVSIGHAYGLPTPMARVGHVAIAYAEIPFAAGGSGHFMVIDTALIGGMSGGPMLSIEGEAPCVVALNQQANAVTGLGKPIEVIMANTRQFWARP